MAFQSFLFSPPNSEGTEAGGDAVSAVRSCSFCRSVTCDQSWEADVRLRERERAPRRLVATSKEES